MAGAETLHGYICGWRKDVVNQCLEFGSQLYVFTASLLKLTVLASLTGARPGQPAYQMTVAGRAGPKLQALGFTTVPESGGARSVGQTLFLSSLPDPSCCRDKNGRAARIPVSTEIWYGPHTTTKTWVSYKFGSKYHQKYILKLGSVSHNSRGCTSTD